MEPSKGTQFEVMKTLCLRCRGVVESPPDRLGTAVPCPHCGEATLFKKPIRPFWVVACDRLKDKNGAYGVPFGKEDSAMSWAKEMSLMPQYRQDIIRVSTHSEPSGGYITAKYKNGEEQLEKLALDSIILECRIFAEYRAKSAANPLTVLVMIGIAVIAWAYGCAWLANLIGPPSGIIIALVIVSAATVALGVVVGREMHERHKKYEGESVKWAREVVHRVLKTSPTLRGRILNTRRKSQPLPWTEDMGDKFGEEIQALERAGFE